MMMASSGADSVWGMACFLFGACSGAVPAHRGLDALLEGLAGVLGKQGEQFAPVDRLAELVVSGEDGGLTEGAPGRDGGQRRRGVLWKDHAVVEQEHLGLQLGIRI